MIDQTANFIIQSITDEISDSESDTTLAVEDASAFPDPADGPIRLVVYNSDEYTLPANDPDVEIMRATGWDTDTNELTVERGMDETSAAAHTSGSRLITPATAGLFDQIDGFLEDLDESKVDQDDVGSAGGVAELNDDALLPAGRLPAIAVIDVFEVGSEEELTDLDAEQGDVGIVTEEEPHEIYLLLEDDPSNLDNWTFLKTDTAPVRSVNDSTGDVMLDSDDVGASAEGHDHSEATENPVQAVGENVVGPTELSTDNPNDKADDPHGNESHTEDFATTDELADSPGDVGASAEGHDHSESGETPVQAVGENVVGPTELSTDNPNDKLDEVDYTPEEDTHDRYTDSEAVDAVDGEVSEAANSVSNLDSQVDTNTGNIGDLDSDKADDPHGNESHTSDYVDAAGAISAVENGDIDISSFDNYGLRIQGELSDHLIISTSSGLDRDVLWFQRSGNDRWSVEMVDDTSSLNFRSHDGGSLLIDDNEVAITDDLFSGNWNDLTGVPAEFTPEEHGNDAHAEEFATTDELADGPEDVGASAEGHDHSEFGENPVQAVGENVVGPTELSTDNPDDKLDEADYTPEDDTHDRYTDAEAVDTVDDEVSEAANSVSELDSQVDTNTGDIGDLESGKADDPHGNESHTEDFATTAEVSDIQSSSDVSHNDTQGGTSGTPHDHANPGDWDDDVTDAANSLSGLDSQVDTNTDDISGKADNDVRENDSQPLIAETRTDDPTDPETGRIWIRSDKL